MVDRVDYPRIPTPSGHLDPRGFTLKSNAVWALFFRPDFNSERSMKTILEMHENLLDVMRGL